MKTFILNSETDPKLLEEIYRQFEEIYERDYKEQLEREHPNEFVAIEFESGQIFFGDTAYETREAAHAAFPDRIHLSTYTGKLSAELARATLGITFYEDHHREDQSGPDAAVARLSHRHHG